MQISFSYAGSFHTTTALAIGADPSVLVTYSFLHSLKTREKCAQASCSFIQIYFIKQACRFQGGGMQLCSSLGITFSCWRRCLCCPWHSSSMFFSIPLGVALAAALARCKALASFPAEACEVCVKSFLAETLQFAWLCFASPRFALHPIDVRSSDPQTSVRNSIAQGGCLERKHLHNTHKKSY